MLVYNIWDASHCTQRVMVSNITSKYCELEGGNVGIVEETRFGMSPKYSRYIGIYSILESCFVSYVSVKSKPDIVVYLFSIVLKVCISYGGICIIDHSYIRTC